MNREQRRLEKRKQRGYSKPPKMRTVWDKLDPIAHAITGASLLHSKARDELSMVELSAIDAFTRGAATINEWSDLANVGNVAQTLAGQGIGREAMPDLHAAEEALIDAAKRYERTGRMGLTGPGLQAVRTMVEWHDAQRDVISAKQYKEALRLTKARVESGYATVDMGECLKAKA